MFASPSRPTPPAPTTPAAALAAPCPRCQTTGGFIPRDSRRPWRGRGYCKTCYTLLNAQMQAHGYSDFAEAAANTPYTGSHYGSPAAEYAHTRAQERAHARLAGGFWPEGAYLTTATCQPIRPFPHGGIRRAA